MPKSIVLLLGAASLAAAPLRAATQAPDLVTDRPDFTESPVSVPRGSVQIETGSTWERANGVDAVSGAEVLVRWSPFGATEIRVGLPDYVRANGDWARSDASLGVKFAFGDLGGWAVALIETATIQVGESFADDGSSGQFILTTGRDLGARASFGSQVSATVGTADGDRTWDFGATAVIGTALTDRLSAFTELALDALEDPYRAVVFHHGYSYLLSPLLQLDFHVALGLNAYAPDAQIGIGLGTRLGG